MRSRSRVRGPLVLVLLAALLGAIGLAAPGAVAQDTEDDAASESRLAIRSIDATDPDDVTVSFFYTGDRDDVGETAVRVDGSLVEDASEAVPLEGGRPLGVVLLIDTSLSMNDGAAIERARDAALSFIENKDPDDRVAVVSFDDDVTVHQDFTQDTAALTEAVEQLAPSGETSLYDGVSRAASMFESGELQPNVLVLSDGADSASTNTMSQAVGALTNSGAAMFAVALQTEGADFGALQQMAEGSGGHMVTTTEPDDLSALFADLQETLRRQYVLTFPTQDISGPIEVTLSVGSEQTSGTYTAGSRQEGGQALQPVPVEEPEGPGFLRSNLGLIIALGLALAAVGLLVYSVGSTFFGENNLDNALRPYDATASSSAESGEDDNAGAMAQTQLLQRAVKMTEDFAQRRGFLEVVEGKLERANLPLRPPEALFFYGASVIVVTLLGVGLTQSLLGAMIFGLLAIIVPVGVVNFLARRRQKQFQSLLPDTLQLLSSTLRAGYSLMQGVEAVAQEVPEPMGRELRRVVTEARLGRPLEESLDAVAKRMDSVDFAWAVMAVGIQREVGGNLSELLLTVAETMTERERLRRDVSALTAEGRVSAMVLGALPVGLAFFISGANPGYLDPLISTTMGNVFIGGALLLMGIGFAWMWKIIQIEV